MPLPSSTASCRATCRPRRAATAAGRATTRPRAGCWRRCCCGGIGRGPLRGATSRPTSPPRSQTPRDVRAAREGQGRGPHRRRAAFGVAGPGAADAVRAALGAAPAAGSGCAAGAAFVAPRRTDASSSTLPGRRRATPCARSSRASRARRRAGSGTWLGVRAGRARGHRRDPGPLRRRRTANWDLRRRRQFPQGLLSRARRSSRARSTSAGSRNGCSRTRRRDPARPGLAALRPGLRRPGMRDGGERRAGVRAAAAIPRGGADGCRRRPVRSAHRTDRCSRREPLPYAVPAPGEARGRDRPEAARASRHASRESPSPITTWRGRPCTPRSTTTSGIACPATPALARAAVDAAAARTSRAPPA